VATQPATSERTDGGARETPASRFQIEEFRAAMEARDPEKAFEHFTEDCQIRPMGGDPYIWFEGREAAHRLFRSVLTVNHQFHYTKHLVTDDLHVLMLRMSFLDFDWEGVDFLRINEEGKCYEMVIMGRPQLPQTIFVGRVAKGLAPHVGPLRRLLLATLLWPLEIAQRFSGRFGAWLIKPALPEATWAQPGADHHYLHGLASDKDDGKVPWI
jgi:SnoaL-like domain